VQNTFLKRSAWRAGETNGTNVFAQEKNSSATRPIIGFGQKMFCGWSKIKTILKQNKKQSRRSEVLFLVQYKFLFLKFL
tara:strand:+ start:5993 stop:6229 length:237 start_codon:yes stop_codon:yes gene_type:complete